MISFVVPAHYEELAMSMALRKLGRVVVVPEPVLTSPRKLHDHSGRVIPGTLARIGLATSSPMRALRETRGALADLILEARR